MRTTGLTSDMLRGLRLAHHNGALYAGYNPGNRSENVNGSTIRALLARGLVQPIPGNAAGGFELTKPAAALARIGRWGTLVEK